MNPKALLDLELLQSKHSHIMTLNIYISVVGIKRLLGL